ncbi:MAG TPA: hypothetical protein VMT28_18410 [Terriglobales bacterium]|jgi:hypothetical protein|nr:hypothetical protein [Terriglobales bacterium]
MAERTWIEQIVEKVVSQVLESHVPRVREELVSRILQEIPQQPGAAPVGSGAGDLLKAISAIHGGSTQREILRALLDNMVRYSGRTALFVMKAGAASGWQGRGFGKNDDAIKDFALDVTSGVAARAMESRMAFKGTPSELDTRFVSQFGAPGDDQVLLIPLRLKDKVAALVYADGGAEGGAKMDTEALELLVTATSAWLEVVSLRKQAQKEGVAEAEKSEAAPVAQTVTSYSDPFAAHAPIHSVAPPVAESPAAEGGAAQPVPEAGEAVAADPVAQMAAEDAEVHRKAQRFARLLVDEIKLYNQAKVAEGRKNRDLYDRLKEDIEKSRATYQKRYGNTAAAQADYFSQEVVRSLAEDDSTLMGANFRR